ncbi:50S ribosomal protein L10 [bacterium]|nr:50S ribosomal protein L10 [bacterium]
MLHKEKEPRIERIVQILSKSNFAFLIDFSGNSVPEIDEFKSAIRESRGDYTVVKNTLAKVAIGRIDDPSWDSNIESCFVKSTALVYGEDDVGACAKAIEKYHKKHRDKFKVKAIIFDKQFHGPDEFKSFAGLLSMDEVKARLLGILKGAQSKFVRLLKTGPRQFAGVLRNYAEKRSGDE